MSGYYDKHGDFHLEFTERGINDPGEFVLTPDLDGAHQPIVTVSMFCTGSGGEELGEVNLGAFRVSISDAYGEMTAGAILSRDEALEFAAALVKAVELPASRGDDGG